MIHAIVVTAVHCDFMAVAALSPSMMAAFLPSSAAGAIRGPRRRRAGEAARLGELRSASTSGTRSPRPAPTCGTASDEFHFVWKRMKGDFQITAEVELRRRGRRPASQARRDDSQEPGADSPYVDVAVHGDGLTSLQFRRTAGEVTEQIMAPIIGADILQLERKGNKFTMRVAWRRRAVRRRRATSSSTSATRFTSGIFVCSHNADVTETGKFRNVRIVVPAPDDFVPYRDYIGSNLEILDVETGRARDRATGRPIRSRRRTGRPTARRSSTTTTAGCIASTWPRATPTEIDTGFATANNNDHVLSFDGKMLASAITPPTTTSKSIVYTVPVEGGEPKRDHAARAVVLPRLVAGRQGAGLHRRSRRQARHLQDLRRRRRGAAADRRRRARRRARVHARRQVDLLQLVPHRHRCRSGGCRPAATTSSR